MKRKDPGAVECTTCGSVAVERTSHTAANPDRKFLSCPRKNCRFFKWVDEIADSKRARTTAPSIASAPHRNVLELKPRVFEAGVMHPIIVHHFNSQWRVELKPEIYSGFDYSLRAERESGKVAPGREVQDVVGLLEQEAHDKGAYICTGRFGFANKYDPSVCKHHNLGYDPKNNWTDVWTTECGCDQSGGISSVPRSIVSSACMRLISSSDVLVAIISSAGQYGTVAEIQFSLCSEKPVFLKFVNVWDYDEKEYWFITSSVLRASLERVKAGKAVSGAWFKAIKPMGWWKSEDEHIKELEAVGAIGHYMCDGKFFCVHCGQFRPGVKFVSSLTRTQVRLVAHIAPSDVREIQSLAETWPPKIARPRFRRVVPFGCKDGRGQVYTSVLQTKLGHTIPSSAMMAPATPRARQCLEEWLSSAWTHGLDDPEDLACCHACGHAIHWLLSKRTPLPPPMVEIISLFVGWVEDVSWNIDKLSLC